MEWVELVVIAVGILIAGMFAFPTLAYRTGLWFSRGYHQGKRESIAKILRSVRKSNEE